MKLGVVDPLSPGGHVSLNAFYLESLGASLAGLVMSEEMSQRLAPRAGGKPFDARPLSRGRLIHALYSLYVTLRSVLSFRVRNIRCVVVLSYDLLVLPFLSLVARLVGVQLVVFEHNTIPFESALKIRVQRLGNPKVVHRVCFREDVARAYREIGQDAHWIPHPILSNRTSIRGEDEEINDRRRDFEGIVFCPSASARQDRILELAAAHPEILFVVKSRHAAEAENCIFREYFDCYDWVMENADYVYLPSDLEWKVSGPFFEALRVGKRIIVDPSGFGWFAKQQFPASVSFASQDLMIASGDVGIDHDINRDINDYNEDVKARLLELCGRVDARADRSRDGWSGRALEPVNLQPAFESAGASHLSH
jgi:hypothetical protein